MATRTTASPSLQVHDHTLHRRQRWSALLGLSCNKKKPKEWRLTQPQTRMRHDPTAMGYLTASIAVLTCSPSRCYDRGHAHTINVSPSQTRARIFPFALQATGFNFMFCDILAPIQATCSICTHADHLQHHSIVHNSSSALPLHAESRKITNNAYSGIVCIN